MEPPNVQTPTTAAPPPSVAARWWATPAVADPTTAPLSFAQERLWFLDRLQPGNPVYSVPSLFPFPGAIDVVALRRALGDLVARHATLRTTFAVERGAPVQRVAGSVTVALPVVAVEGTTREDRRAAAYRLVEHEIQRPFDLAAGPVFRPVLYRIDDDEHWLSVTFHHIVYDAWSMTVFFRELGWLYDAHRLGTPATLPPLPLQYTDYARWQRRWLTEDVLARLSAYWKDQLRGAPAVLELPLDHPRPAMVSSRGAMLPFTLSAETADRLRELSRKEQTTLFITMLATYNALLHRYTGQRDIVVGTPIANRDRSDLESLIGLFLNTLVVRTRFGDARSFRDLLRRVRAVTLEAYEHQDLPFERLVEEVQPDRNLNINPLFQVFFVLQHGAADTSGQGPLRTGTSKFDLSLYLTDTGREIAGAWEYNTDLFEPATIARLAGHLIALVDGIAADPDAPIARLPLLTAAELDCFRAWNDTAAPYPRDQCAHQLVEAQARATPDATALVFGDRQLSYAALDARANQLAHHLRALGAGPGAAVGLCLERSIDMVVALLGVLKAGAAYLPMDPSYPPERLAYMVEAGATRVVVGHRRLAAALPAERTVVWIDDDPTLATEPTAAPAPAARPDHLAYVIFTSGSTGRAKGVEMSHRTLTNLTVWQNGLGQIGAADRTLQYNSFSFDVSCLEVTSTLSTGGTLVLVSDEVRRNVSALAQLLVEQRITRIFMPYTALAHLAEHLGGRPLPGTCLRQIISTGEALQITPHITELVRQLPGCHLHNEYGPTETHFVTEHTLDHDQTAAWPRLPPVGRPIPNASAHILDELHQPVPVGVVGELYAGGLAVARGYIGRPELTAERFLPDPFAHEPGARMYKTGDLARYLPDGTIVLLGRRDYQVKVRGFRIELGEIEVVLGTHPDLREVVATAHRDATGNLHLIAYVVAQPDRTPTGAELRRFLLDKIPEYMVPGLFLVMDQLPTGATGKVDRYRLPDPASFAQGGEDIVAPRNDIEDELAKIFCELLLRDRVSIHDSFFSLGGHSLVAVQLATRIRERLDVELPLQRIFEIPTIAELATEIVQHQVEGIDPAELARLLDEVEGLPDGET